MLGFTDVEKLEENYMVLSEKDFGNVAHELKTTNDAVYVVMPSGGRNLDFPLSYFNDKYKIYKVPSLLNN